MVEEFEERFTEEKIEKLMEVIRTELPDHSTSPEAMDVHTSTACCSDNTSSAATAEP